MFSVISVLLLLFSFFFVFLSLSLLAQEKQVEFQDQQSEHGSQHSGLDGGANIPAANTTSRGQLRTTSRMSNQSSLGRTRRTGSVSSLPASLLALSEVCGKMGGGGGKLDFSLFIQDST